MRKNLRAGEHFPDKGVNQIVSAISKNTIGSPNVK
jgi:hypothetical protein